MIPLCDIDLSRIAPADREEDFVTTEEASEILGLHRSQTRALLGEPDYIWFSACGHIQYVFERSRVMEVKQKRDERKQKRLEDLGKLSCIFCRKKFVKSELTSGICPACQARKFIRNFVCCGDCCRKRYDARRLQTLLDALNNFEKENEDIIR